MADHLCLRLRQYFIYWSEFGSAFEMEKAGEGFDVIKNSLVKYDP